MPQDHAAPVLSLVRAQVVLVANLGDLFFVLLARARQECVGHAIFRRLNVFSMLVCALEMSGGRLDPARGRAKARALRARRRLLLREEARRRQEPRPPGGGDDREHGGHGRQGSDTPPSGRVEIF